MQANWQLIVLIFAIVFAVAAAARWSPFARLHLGWLALTLFLVVAAFGRGAGAGWQLVVMIFAVVFGCLAAARWPGPPPAGAPAPAWPSVFHPGWVAVALFLVVQAFGYVK